VETPCPRRSYYVQLSNLIYHHGLTKAVDDVIALIWYADLTVPPAPPPLPNHSNRAPGLPVAYLFRLSIAFEAHEYLYLFMILWWIFNLFLGSACSRLLAYYSGCWWFSRLSLGRASGGTGLSLAYGREGLRLSNNGEAGYCRHLLLPGSFIHASTNTIKNRCQTVRCCCRLREMVGGEWTRLLNWFLFGNCYVVLLH